MIDNKRINAPKHTQNMYNLDENESENMNNQSDPEIVNLGKISDITLGSGTQYQDGRKYSERQ